MASKSNQVHLLNRSHTALTLSEPMPNPEKAGDAPPLRSFSVAGNGAVTTVDAEAYQAWKAANPHHAFLSSGVLEEVGEGYVAEAEQFGFEIGLSAAAKDKDAVKASEAGVAIESEAGALTSADMTPVNSTAPTDMGGEPRHASQPGEPEPELSRGTRPAKK